MTNSSSYSSAVIRIQSKKLVDLLKQYEELFRNDPYDEDDFDEGSAFHNTYISGCTLCADEDEVADSVLDCLIYALGKYACTEAQKERRSQMFAEIVAHKQELTDSIQKVSWEFEDENHGEFKPEGPRLRRFTYDRSAGGTGTYEECFEDEE